MRAPQPRGPLTSALLETLAGEPGSVPVVVEAARDAVARAADVLSDDDVQLALLVLYELHYRGVDGVADGWEWQPDLLRARAVLEDAFEAAVRALVPVPAPAAVASHVTGVEVGTPGAPRRHPTASQVADALFELTAADDGPSVASYVARRATNAQLHEFVVHRSIYHLKEADPHSWALPRLSGRAKSALIEVQADEYGGGRPGHIHSELFAGTMRALGLDDADGAYVDVVPAPTLANVNLMSLFGLHRRLRGAIVGHLAAFEMTSSIPCRKYGNGFRRLGHGPEATLYFDEHVEADAVHEQIAGRDLAGGLVEAEPHLLDDVLWGAAAYLAVDGLAGAQMLAAWQAGESALRGPVVAAA